MLPWKYPGFLTRILLPEALFQGNPSDNRIYLTYDDGPDPEVTPILLDLLAEYNARATFFVVANDASWWPDMLQQIDKRGHQIALHGERHRSKYTLSNLKLYTELTELIARISHADIEPMKMYRPPFGHIRPDTVRFLHKRGIHTVLWSNIPGDFRKINGEKLFRRATHNLRPGAILALHDGVKFRPAPVLELTKKLLDTFQERGWSCDALNYI